MVLRVTMSLLAPGKPGQAPIFGAVTDFFQCAQQSRNRGFDKKLVVNKKNFKL